MNSKSKIILPEPKQIILPEGVNHSNGNMGKRVAREAKIEKLLKQVSYVEDPSYVPSSFSLLMINFIKSVGGEDNKESHLTPLVHARLLDTWDDNTKDSVIDLCHRGLGKTTLIEYAILITSAYGGMPNFGKFRYGVYVGDTMKAGVKKMKNRLVYQMEHSSFLQGVFEETNLTDERWYFRTFDGVEMVYTGHSAEKGPRGSVELKERISLAFFDDLLSDKNAKSAKIIESIRDTIYATTEYALSPDRSKIIWAGTPFNALDPLYKAVNSEVWHATVFPVCEKFPCEKEEFISSWTDRFTYEYVKKKYDKAVHNYSLNAFYKELMLQIASEDQKLVKDDDIQWTITRQFVMQNKELFNFYIVTDFATTAQNSGDYSVIGVIAYSSIGQIVLIDGICKKQEMNANISDLIRLCSRYKPISVGLEVSGQQKGFVSLIKDEQIRSGVHFDLALETNPLSARVGNIGFHPTEKKLDRFKVLYPRIEARFFHVVPELEETDLALELLEELSLITTTDIKAAHDDVIDMLAQIPLMDMVKPMIDETKKETPKEIVYDDKHRSKFIEDSLHLSSKHDKDLELDTYLMEDNDDFVYTEEFGNSIEDYL